MGKKITALILAAVLTIGLLPSGGAFAAHDISGENTDLIAEQNSEENAYAEKSGAQADADYNGTSREWVYINPLYEGIISPDDADNGEVIEAPKVDFDSAEYLSSLEEAGAVIRAAMTERRSDVTVLYKTAESDPVEVRNGIFEEAIKYTGSPREGDYLAWQYGYYRCACNTETQDGENYYAFKFEISYYTTAEQEERVTERVAALLSSFGFDENTGEYEKAREIYDYICTHVSYYDDTNGDDDNLRYTAYGALFEGEAVCQGMSLLFYRMAMESGISSRIISGNQTSHGWNIVKLGDNYYNLDITWECVNARSGQAYSYFLKGSSGFRGHVRDSKYTEEAFTSAFPVPTYNYDNTGYDFAEYTYVGGELLITGEGMMPEYSGGAPWAEAAKKAGSIRISSPISHISASSFAGSVNAESVYLPDTLRIIGDSAFAGSTSLKELDIPDSVYSIGKSAFSGCTALGSVTIGKNVVYIAGEAFEGCDGLTDIYFTGDAPELGENALPSGVTVHYPQGNGTWKVSGGKWNGYRATDGSPEIVKEAPKLEINNNDGNIKITWEQVPGAVGYDLYRSTNGRDYSYIKTSPAEASSFTNVSVKTGVRYYYRINAVYETEGGTEYSEYSNTVSAVAVKLTQITSVKGRNDGIAVSWLPVSGADGYAVYRYEAGSGAEPEQIAYTGTCSYTDKKASPGVEYIYTVRTAAKTEGRQFYSTDSALENGIWLLKPALTGISNTNGNIRISWQPVSGASGYEVYRSTDGKNYKLVKTSSSEAGSFTNVSVVTGTRYYYKIRAVNDRVSEKTYSEYSDIKSSVAVKLTEINEVRSASDHIEVSWNGVPGASAYRLYRAEGEGTDIEFVVMNGGANISGTKYIDRDIKPGTVYTYRIKTMVRVGGVNNYSCYSQWKSGSLVPPPVVTSIDNSGGRIKITWSGTEGAGGYEIYRSTDGKSYRLVKSSGGDARSFTNVSVTTGTKYYYRVRAVYGDGNRERTAYSNTLSAVAVKTAQLQIPAVGRDGSSLVLKWDKVANADAYRIYRAVNDGQFIYCDMISGNEYTDKDISAGNVYTYRIKTMVRAYGVNNYSSYSNIVSLDIPEGPEITAVYNSEGGLRVEWVPLENAVSYNVYRSTDGVNFELVRQNSPYRSFNNKSVVPGVTYYYRVTAYLDNGTYTGTSEAKSEKVSAVDKILYTAAGEIGTMENPPGSNKVKYNTWYYGYEAGGEYYAWCMVFVQWVFTQAKFPLPYRTASCTAMMNYAKETGRWVTKDFKPGDVILFQFDDDPLADHTGICESVTENGIYCIEGNTGLRDDDLDDGVMRRFREYGEIMGAYRPDYP